MSEVAQSEIYVVTNDKSQGTVATYLMCSGICKCEFVANLSLSLLVKKIENQLTFGEVMGKRLVSCFLTHGVDIFSYL